MKRASVGTVLVVLSTLSVIQEEVVGTGGGESVKLIEIEEACKYYSVDKDVCISSLKNDPNCKGANLTGLAYIAIRIAAQSASDIDQHLRSLMINSNPMSSLNTEDQDQQGLANCVKFYRDANAQLHDSIAALLSKNASSDVQKSVNLAIANSESCDGSINHFGQKQNFTIISKNKDFRQVLEDVLNMFRRSADRLPIGFGSHMINGTWPGPGSKDGPGK